MSLALFSDLGRNLLVRTLIATAAVFLFLGFATGALPVRCLAEGLTACGAVPSIAPQSAAAPLRFAPPPAQPVKVAAIVPTGPTLTDNEVVADSFALLPADVQPAVPLATSWKSTAASDESALATRTVKTVSIHADGTPETTAGVAETPATQVAETSPTGLPAVAPLVAPAAQDSATNAIDAVAPDPVIARPAATTKLALVEDTPPPKPAPKQTTKKTGSNGTSATVTGQGANVHASSGSSSKVVFALAGGTKVTVLESSHGWVHITDSKGRSGWMYKVYLS